MIFNEKQARELEILVHPDVEKGILHLLELAFEQKKTILSDPSATMESLKMFQGQSILITELKEYKKRLTDAIKRPKDG